MLHLLYKAGHSVVAVDTFVQDSLHPFLLNCLNEGYSYYHKLHLMRGILIITNYAWIYFLLILLAFCSDEEISTITLDAIKHLAEIPEGIVSILFVHMFFKQWIGDAKIIFFQDIIFPPDGRGSLQLDKVSTQSS